MNDAATNWAKYLKIDWYFREHHERYKRYVEREGLLCQECGGVGEYSELIEPGLPRVRYSCGWCEGTGLVTRWIRGFWLREKKAEKLTGFVYGGTLHYLSCLGGKRRPKWRRKAVGP